MDPFIKLARWAALASGLAAIVQLTFIFIFYAGVTIFGPLNDIAYSLQILFTIPLVLLSQRSLAAHGRLVRVGVTGFGLLACLAILTLQLLLIFRVIPFTQQIGFLLLAILMLPIWFVLVERFSPVDSIIPRGTWLAVLAGLSFGYPVWAYRLRKNLNAKIEPQTELELELAQ